MKLPSKLRSIVAALAATTLALTACGGETTPEDPETGTRETGGQETTAGSEQEEVTLVVSW